MDIPVVAARNYDLLLGNDWLLQSSCQMCWDSRRLRVMVTPNEYDEIDFDVDGNLKAPSPLHYMQALYESPTPNNKPKLNQSKIPRKPGQNARYD